jgi:hypothetical protein
VNGIFVGLHCYVVSGCWVSWWELHYELVRCEVHYGRAATWIARFVVIEGSLIRGQSNAA